MALRIKGHLCTCTHHRNFLVECTIGLCIVGPTYFILQLALHEMQMEFERVSCNFFTVTNLLCSCCTFLPAIDFKIRTIELDGKKIKLQIWYELRSSNYCGLQCRRKIMI